MANGWVENPNGDTPGWWLWAGSDAARETNWTQTRASDPRDGFAPDVNNAGWYFNGGDPQNLNDWWHDETVADEPEPIQPQIIPVPGVPNRSSRDGRLPVAL